MKHYLLAIAVLIAASSLVFGQKTQNNNANQMDKDEQAVRKVFSELLTALPRKDIATLERTYGEDYMLVDSFGIVKNKAQRIAAIKSGETKYESVSHQIESVRLFGNTAVLIVRNTVKGQSDGQDMSGQERATNIFVKTKGGWKSVSAQITRIVAP